ncbi:hypothetical protein DY000_02007942 [Brassica cretica]|uniref:Uncharacterized protein n=1 Tax=Brassica cretica TaxID=69181 RepID=A0ABQ7C0X7_BRACR|nr:hypothetical protein DY000_02007942 [Brassica cretica]
MSDPYYNLMKADKRECDWLYAVADANYGIPTKCACSQPIGVETGEQGRHYYVCKQCENDVRDEAINYAKLESKVMQIILKFAELKKLVNG